MDFEGKSITLRNALKTFENLDQIQELRLSADIDSLDSSFQEETSEILQYIPNLSKLLILYTSPKNDDLLHINISNGISESIESMYLEGIDLSEINLSEFFKEHPILASIRLDNCNISNIEFLENLPDLAGIDLTNNPIPSKYADYILDIIQRKSILINISGCTEILKEFEKKDFTFSKFLTDKEGKLDGESFYQAYQKALFSRDFTVRDMQQLSNHINFFSEKLANDSRNIYLDDIEEFDEEYISSINHFAAGENTTLVITPENATKLIGKVSKDINVQLLIRNASELSVEQLDMLSEHYNLSSIKINDPDQSLNSQQTTPYDVETYRKCRSTIDELLDGIDVSENSDDPNRDKKLFGKVIKILANHMSYDYESLRKEEMASMKFFEYAVANYEAEVSDSPDTLDILAAITREDEFDESISIVCRNMEGGLLNGTCVCAGYTEIARNVFSCLNIPIKYIWGYNLVDQEEAAHAWNEIKLDGKWYNMDLTRARDGIVAGEEPKSLLQSDKDFYTEEHPYHAEPSKSESCNHTVSVSDLMKYIYGIEISVDEIEAPQSKKDSQITYYPPRGRTEEYVRVASLPKEHRAEKELLEIMESNITQSDIERSYDILIKTNEERTQPSPSIEMEEH